MMLTLGLLPGPAVSCGLVLIAMTLAPALTNGATGDPSAELATLLDARLELMRNVASHKWQHGLAIDDPAREAVVLERAVTEALELGFTRQSSRALFAAQIEAAKAVQRYWFDIWRSGAPVPEAPDLNGVIRPRLLELGNSILATAARLDAPVSPEAFAEHVDVEGLGAAERDRLRLAVAGLSRYSDRLEQVLDTGRLRIGTTGDYAPFTFRETDDRPFTGIDIDLGRMLAAALGVEAEFVPTSWPGLLDDLQAGRFDVAMGGVSRTVERARHGYLSSPYYVGGKAAIARCDRAAEFPTLAAIDRSSTRVIVNPGGTNERFVDSRLHQARKLIHEDNRTIFAEIVAGRADLMITDRVEVELQAARHTELCATLEAPLTYQEKAYLMPREVALKEFVETWLALALADGTVGRVFRDHGVEPRLPGVP